MIDKTAKKNNTDTPEQEVSLLTPPMKKPEFLIKAVICAICFLAIIAFGIVAIVYSFKAGGAGRIAGGFLAFVALILVLGGFDLFYFMHQLEKYSMKWRHKIKKKWKIWVQKGDAREEYLTNDDISAFETSPANILADKEIRINQWKRQNELDKEIANKVKEKIVMKDNTQEAEKDVN